MSGEDKNREQDGAKTEVKESESKPPSLERLSSRYPSKHTHHWRSRIKSVAGEWGRRRGESGRSRCSYRITTKSYNN